MGQRLLARPSPWPQCQILQRRLHAFLTPLVKTLRRDLPAHRQTPRRVRPLHPVLAGRRPAARCPAPVRAGRANLPALAPLPPGRPVRARVCRSPAGPWVSKPFFQAYRVCLEMPTMAAKSPAGRPLFCQVSSRMIRCSGLICGGVSAGSARLLPLGRRRLRPSNPALASAGRPSVSHKGGTSSAGDSDAGEPPSDGGWSAASAPSWGPASPELSRGKSDSEDGGMNSLGDIRPPFLRAAPTVWEEGFLQTVSCQLAADISERWTSVLG